MSRKAINRQDSIIMHLSKLKESTVSEMTQRFLVSEATIRRDLKELEELGKLTRTYGGARFIENPGSEPPIYARMDEDTPIKEEIGKTAASLIENGDTIFISSGTTAYQVARYLTNHKDLTVITNSLPVINHLCRNSEITLIVLGGIVRHSEQSITGQTTERTLAEFRTDKVILGVRAIHAEHGLTNDAQQETQIDRQLFEITRNIIIVADHTKFGKIASRFLAPLSSVSHIVTDAIPEHDRKVFQELGIDILISGNEPV